MGRGGEGQIFPNGGGGAVSVAQKPLGLLRFLPEDKLAERNAGLGVKPRGQVGAPHIQRLGQLLGGDGLGKMLLHVVGHHLGQPPRMLPQMQPLHPSGEFQHHVVLQVGDLLRRVQPLAALYIGVAEGEGVVHVQPAPYGRPGAQRSGDDEEILQVRSKDFKMRLLDGNRVLKEKTFWQVLNVALPLALVLLLGIVMFLVRRFRYHTKKQSQQSM